MTVAPLRQFAADHPDKSSERDILCWAIEELQRQQEAKSCVDVRQRDNIRLQDILVKLIGRKPWFQCQLEGVSSEVLWDTGSMISMVDSDWLSEKCPSVIMHPISDFLDRQENGEQPKSVEFVAANNTKVPMIGCVVLIFTMGGISFPIPVLVTSSKISQPIVGFNVMEHMIMSGQKDVVIDSLMNSSRTVDVSNVEAVVNMVAQSVEDEDFLGDLHACKPCVVPAKSSVRIRCKVKGDVKGLSLPFVCSEPLTADWDDGLIVTESLGELTRGKTPHVNIEIRNTTGKDKHIRKNMIVGEISVVSAVLPLKLFNSSPVDSDDERVEIGNVDVSDSEKWQPKADLKHLSEQERKEIEELLFEECEVFAKTENDIGDIRDFQMDINLTDQVPVNEAYRHLPRKLYEDVKAYLNDLVVNGWIQESSSDYASPIVCIRKKDGTMRLCCDYRKLNLKTQAERQPIPRVQDLLDGLHGQNYFSTLDMAKAYHQGYVKDICRKYTAFSTPWALFEWLRIPFGLKNAPAAFQRYINNALSGLLDKACLAYLDDILIFGKTFREHKMNLRSVLKRLKSKGVKLRVDKCEFCKPEVRYLGRLVSADGYRADPEDVQALEKFREAPKNVGEVRSLVGFLGYYRSYVKDFAKCLKPVYDLLKTDLEHVSKVASRSSSNGSCSQKSKVKCYDKKRKIVWTSDLQKRVDDIIDTLKSPTVMAFPDFNQPFVLNCDASGHGLGAVLYQKQKDKMRVLSYASRTLSDAEKNYYLHSGKLEFLALKWSVTDKFSDYLGHGAKCTVFTDNNPLTYILTSAKLNATGMRWVASLAEYDLELKYRPGKNNADADGLSRNPLPIEEMQRICTETCDQNVLPKMLSCPNAQSAHCYSVHANLLQCPPLPEIQGKPLSKDDLKQAQLSDVVVGPVHRAVSLGKRPSRHDWKELSKKTKVLFHQWKKLSVVDGILTRKTDRHTQIVLPELYRHIVYIELHQKMGHLGLERVEDLARRRFFWPYMSSDIEYFIKKKCSCVISKKPNVEERAPLVPIHATYPFEIISIDFLKVDKCNGFEYILVVTDHFTRFAQAYATRKNSSRAAADKLFNHFILQFGYPKRIHHDKGREFNSNLFKHLHALTKIDMSNTTAYHPQGDGQCERLNRTVINMLKSIPENEKRRWKDHLPKLMFAYNATVNKTTNFSPFYLLFGREAHLPVDDFFPGVANTNVAQSKTANYGEFVKTYQNRMSEAFQLANRNIEKSQNYNKQKYDQKAHSVDLQVGDRVLVKNVRPQGTTMAGKLSSYWEPVVYEVVEKCDNLPVYIIRDHFSPNVKTKKLHRNLLKKVNELVVPSSTSSDSTHADSTVSSPPVAAKSGSSRSLGRKGQVQNHDHSKKETATSCHIDSENSDDDDDCTVVIKKTKNTKRPLQNVPILGPSETLSGQGDPSSVVGEERHVNELIRGDVSDLDQDSELGDVESVQNEHTIIDGDEGDDTISYDLENESYIEGKDSSSEIEESDVEVEIERNEADSDEFVDVTQNVTSEVEESDIEVEIEGNEAVNNDELGDITHNLTSEMEESDVEEDIEENEPDSEEFHSTFDDSLDLEEVEESPLRRSERCRTQTKVLDYQVLGIPKWKPRKNPVRSRRGKR